METEMQVLLSLVGARRDYLHPMSPNPDTKVVDQFNKLIATQLTKISALNK